MGPIVAIDVFGLSVGVGTIVVSLLLWVFRELFSRFTKAVEIFPVSDGARWLVLRGVIVSGIALGVVIVLMAVFE